MKKLILLTLLVNINVFCQENNLNNKGQLNKNTETTNNKSAKIVSIDPFDPINPIDPLDPIDPIDPLDPINSEVGATSGNLSVSMTGGANYSIPILVPPGINGVVPQISLNYNSQGGFGYAGFGWNLGGISKITRIPSTLYHDGIIDPVDSDGLDRFALDGQRLILKSGIYGQIGSTYETENFSTIKVSYLTNGLGYNTYFKVEYPDGSIGYYGFIENGNTELSLVEWPITKWENSQNLKICYEYYQAGFLNEYCSLIKSIKYGSNTNEGINKIEFIYKNTINPDSYYFWGANHKKNKILSEIKVFGNNTPLRNYYLTHDLTSTRKERLIGIQEKTGDNSKSLNPTIFTYNKNQTDYNSGISYSHRGDFLPSQNAAVGDFDGDGENEFYGGQLVNYGYNGYLTELNSDYTTTIINTNGVQNINVAFNFLNSELKISNKQGIATFTSNFGSSSVAKMYSLNTTSNTFELEYERPFNNPILSNVNKESTEFTVPFSPGQNSYGGFYSDFNGDKLTDMVFYKIVNGTLSTQFLNMDRRITSNYFFNSGDFNVGISTPIINNPVGYNPITSNPTTYNGTTKVFEGDYNGDGISDLYVLRGAPYNKIEVYSLQNNLFVKIFETTYTLPGDIWNTVKHGVSIGDFNGDGKSDILMVLAGKILISKGTITGNFAEELLPNYIVKPDPSKSIFYLTWDINNDGKSDILRLEKNYESAYLQKCGACAFLWWIKAGIKINYYEKSKGNWTSSFFEKVTQDYINNSVPNDPTDDNTFRYSSYPVLVKKKEGNEYVSILGISGESIQTAGQIPNYVTSYFNFNRHLDEQNLLNSAIDGNGVSDSIIYDNLVDGNGHYEKASTLENYPYYNLLSGKFNKVVTEISKSFENFNKKKKYKYQGAIFDLADRGIVGFKSSLSTNWFNESSQIISNITKFDFLKNGLPVQSFSVVGLKNASFILSPSDSFINKTINTYNYEDTNYVNPLLANKVYKIFKTKTEDFNGLNDTSSLNSILYNNNKNPIQITQNIRLGSNVVKTINESFTYSPIVTNPYIVDRPLTKTNVSTIFPSNDISSSEEIYEYDVNLLKKIEKRSTNSNQTTPFLTETNQYDVYGNIIQKKLSITGMTDRISNFEYDSTTHRFLTKKIDIEGLVTEYNYDLTNGLIISETLPSNLGFPITTTYNYDKWGKNISITDYLGNVETITYKTENNVFIAEKKSTDGTTSSIIKDNLGRTIQEAKIGFEGNWSLITKEYDIYDRPIKISQPYFGTVGDITSYNIWNEMSYDIYGRMIQSNSLKNSSTQGKVTNYSYNGLITTENDGQKIKTTTIDALGNIISISESPGASDVTYQYYANSNLKSTTSSGSNTTILQDGWGRKKQLNDPSAGIFNYVYNNFGELISEEVVGKGTTTYNLDVNGKLLSKTIVGIGTDTTNSLTTNNYNANTKLLESSVFNDLTNNYTITNNYVYNDYKVLTESTEIRKNGTSNIFKFQKNIEYDDYGRPEREFLSALDYATGKKSEKWIKNEYNNFGYKSKVINDSDNSALWTIDKVNASGKLLSAFMTANRKITNTFDVFGFPLQTKVDKLSSNLMTLNTTFDPIYGNLISRTCNLFGTWNENLTYDSLDRLKNYKSNAGIEVQNYNSNGTIASNNIGSYAYTNSNKPFQVSTITPVFPSAVYNYYNTREQNITYNVFKSPVTISELTKEKIDFEYNSSNGRTAMYYGDLQNVKTNRSYRKYYSADGLMEIKYKLSAPTSIEFISYIGGDGYTAPIVLKGNGTSQEYLNLHRDYQGTILAITNSLGVVVEKRLFDVWGSLIQYSNTNGINTVPTNSTSMLLDRGYTGHEHLLGVGLINMNGRIYDDRLHKFLQPDNNIQDPYNIQNFNRYGYVLNNPTKYTDPSGEFWEIVAGFIFSAYVHGAQATGEANPFKWNAGQFANAAMGASSIMISNYASDKVNGYIQNYGSVTSNDDSSNSGKSKNKNHEDEKIFTIEKMHDFFKQINDNYHKGIYDRVNEVYNFFDTKITSSIYWANTLTKFGSDLMNGRSLYFNASEAYQKEVFYSVAGMTINDWAYVAGYSSPDVAVSYVSPFALESAASKIGNIQIPIYRVYGGGSSMYGKSYTIFNPKYVPYYRYFAGIPNINTGEFLLKGYIPLRDVNLGRWFAAPLDGNPGMLPIELYQNYNQLNSPTNLTIKKPF